MHFVGVDLAWGDRRPTGLAVLDDEGHLVHVSTVSTDDEIVAALSPYVDGDCVVAIDAPLVVVNPTGNRPAEAALNRDFRAFEAGAHPSNTAKPEFSDLPRGARVCELLGLDMDPASQSSRRAVEVYPHPATVSLFRLGRTLKYKDKPGRSFEYLRTELVELMRHLTGLATAETALHVEGEPWQLLAEEVAAATRKSQLRVVEDQVDAVVCAYVARFASLEPENTTTYGDFETGYIVTPTLPADHEPGARQPQERDATAGAVHDYALLRPALVTVADTFVALVTAVLDDAGINYLSVTGRAKSVASFAAKAARTLDGEPVYPSPLADITDQIGVRVITYVHSDVAAVADLLRDQGVVLDDRDMGQETASEGRFGYASRHLLLELGASDAPEHEVLRGHRAQVQIRTVVQHAWAEFEHDIRYKGTIPDEHVPDLDRRFTLAAGLLELADREFSMIRDRLQAGMTGVADQGEDDDPRISPRELAAFLAGQYSDAGWSRTEHYAWISGLLLELGITSLSELADALRPLDGADLNERMDYRYPPGAVRRLDDALLATFGDSYVRLHGNADREAALQARLMKLAGG